MIPFSKILIFQFALLDNQRVFHIGGKGLHTGVLKTIFGMMTPEKIFQDGLQAPIRFVVLAEIVKVSCRFW